MFHKQLNADQICNVLTYLESLFFPGCFDIYYVYHCSCITQNNLIFLNVQVKNGCWDPTQIPVAYIPTLEF